MCFVDDCLNAVECAERENEMVVDFDGAYVFVGGFECVLCFCEECFSV